MGKERGLSHFHFSPYKIYTNPLWPHCENFQTYFIIVEPHEGYIMAALCIYILYSMRIPINVNQKVRYLSFDFGKVPLSLTKCENQTFPNLKSLRHTTVQKCQSWELQSFLIISVTYNTTTQISIQTLYLRTAMYCLNLSGPWLLNLIPMISSMCKLLLKLFLNKKSFSFCQLCFYYFV